MSKNARKTREGVVVSTNMDKTIVVMVTRIKKDAKVGKECTSTKNYTAHDEENKCKVGDRVIIMETRPLSKTKRWRLVEVVEESK